MMRGKVHDGKSFVLSTTNCQYRRHSCCCRACDRMFFMRRICIQNRTSIVTVFLLFHILAYTAQICIAEDNFAILKRLNDTMKVDNISSAISDRYFGNHIKGLNRDLQPALNDESCADNLKFISSSGFSCTDLRPFTSLFSCSELTSFGFTKKEIKKYTKNCRKSCRVCVDGHANQYYSKVSEIYLEGPTTQRPSSSLKPSGSPTLSNYQISSQDHFFPTHQTEPREKETDTFELELLKSQISSQDHFPLIHTTEFNFHENSETPNERVKPKKRFYNNFSTAHNSPDGISGIKRIKAPLINTAPPSTRPSYISIPAEETVQVESVIQIYYKEPTDIEATKNERRERGHSGHLAGSIFAFIFSGFAVAALVFARHRNPKVFDSIPIFFERKQMDDNKILLQKDTMSEVSRDEILSSNMSCEFSVRWDEESACDTGDGVVAVLATNNSTNTSEDIVTTFDEGTIELQLVSRSTSIDYKASGELIDIDFGKKYIHDGTIEKSNENFSMDGPKRKAGFQSIPKFRFSNSNIFRSAASRLETTLNDKNLNFARRKPFKSMKQFPGNNNQSTTDLPGNLFKGFREALSIPIGDHDSHQKFNEQEVQRKKPKRIDTPLKFQTQKEYPHKELQLKQQKQNEKPRVQKTQHFQHKNLVEKQVIRKEHSPEKEQITQKERHFKREQEGQADTLYKPAHVQQQQIKTPRMHIPSIERGSNVPINHIHPVSTINQPNLYRQRRVIRFPSAHALPEEAQFKRIISTDDTSNTCIHLDESSKGDFSRDETSLESVKEVVILAPKTQAISPETVLTMETFETVEEASTNYMEIQSRNYKEVQPSYQSHTRTEKEFRNPPPSVERRTRRRDRRSSVHREPVSVVSSVVSTASSYSTIDVRSDGPSVGPSVDTNRTLSTDVSDGMSITSRATRVTQSSMVTHNTRTYQSGGLAYRKRNGRWTVSANQETEPKMTSYGGIADKYLDFIYDYFVDE